jgi:hypothetical protein
MEVGGGITSFKVECGAGWSVKKDRSLMMPRRLAWPWRSCLQDKRLSFLFDSLLLSWMKAELKFLNPGSGN